jgi:prefoldin beta subunit
MPEVTEETKNLITQFQNYQQQLQSILIQKESLKLQNIEIERALEELNATTQKTAYKITGQIMINKPVEELKKELNETKENIDLRIKSLEKTEERISNKLKELQNKLKEVIR